MNYTTTITLVDLHKAISNSVLIPFSKLRNLVPLWERLVPIIHNTTMARFSKGGPGWAALAPKTVAQRIREGSWRVGVSSDQPILQRWGPLRQSVQSSLSGGSSQHTETVTPRYFSYGTGLKKAAYLQGDLDAWIPGAPRNSYSGLAPRPFLYLDVTDQERVLDEAVIQVMDYFK